MKLPHLIHIAAAALVGAALVTWLLTGHEGYTRWPDARLAHADAPPAAGENELLSEAGFTDNRTATTRPDIQSRFALGLVPGGADPRHLLSVAAAVAAALLASGSTIALQSRSRFRRPAQTNNSSPGAHP